jgi:hypothetical protein
MNTNHYISGYGFRISRSTEIWRDSTNSCFSRVTKNPGRGVGTAGIARKWEGERRVRKVFPSASGPELLTSQVLSQVVLA